MDDDISRKIKHLPLADDDDVGKERKDLDWHWLQCFLRLIPKSGIPGTKKSVTSGGKNTGQPYFDLAVAVSSWCSFWSEDEDLVVSSAPDSTPTPVCCLYSIASLDYRGSGDDDDVGWNEDETKNKGTETNTNTQKDAWQLNHWLRSKK